MKRINKFGIGADIESIKRFKKIDRNNNRLFLDKIFTKNEIEYCFAKGDAAPHLAARFSAKEAVYKALYSIGGKDLYFKDIEILNNEHGVPTVRINNKSFDDLHICLSLSHCEDKAIAFAIITHFED